VLEVLRILGGAAAVVLACAGAGRALWRWKPPAQSIAFATGAAALSAAMFALLATGLYGTPAIAAVLAVAVAAGRWGRPSFKPAPWWAVASMAVFGVFYAVHALAPEIQPDAAGYHLGLPAQWLREGGFSKTIGFFEMLPLGIETLFGAAMALGGASAAKLFHFVFLVLTIPLTIHVARRLGLSDQAGWAAALLYAITPVVGISGTSAYTDAALVFAHLALFAVLLEWKDTPTAAAAAQAGLIAGLCYSIKVTGVIPFVAVAAFMLLGKRAWSTAAFAAGAAAVALPWAAKAWWLTGNPLAPLGNAWFDNDAFNAATEQALGSYLRSYDVASWMDIPRALLVDGGPLQGLLGPVFALSVLSLAAIRKPAGRWLLAASAVASVPWVMNIGARFLMPAMPLVWLAAASVIPVRALPAIVLLHGALSLPIAMDRYAGAGAWRLKGWPWEAALRIQPEVEYLRKTYFEYRPARMVAEQVKPGEQIVDLTGLPTLYTQTPAHGPLPTALFDQMTSTLAAAAAPVPERLYEARFAVPQRFMRGVKVRLTEPSKLGWPLAELRFERQGERVSVPRTWFLRAWPLPQDAALTVDGNRATRWQTYGPAKEGGFVEVLFDRPVPFDAFTVVSPMLARGGPAMDVYGLTMDRQWIRMRATGAVQALAPVPLRGEAMAFLKSLGIKWIVAPDSEIGHGPVGRSLMTYPNAWRVERVKQIDGVWLFRLQ
jgi:hypothetical protein